MGSLRNYGIFQYFMDISGIGEMQGYGVSLQGPSRYPSHCLYGWIAACILVAPGLSQGVPDGEPQSSIARQVAYFRLDRDGAGAALRLVGHMLGEERDHG